MLVPMLGLNYSFFHKRTARPLDQMQQLHLSITESSSLLEMGLGARPQEPSLGVLTVRILYTASCGHPLSNPVSARISGCVRKRTNHYSGDLITVDAQR